MNERTKAFEETQDEVGRENERTVQVYSAYFPDPVKRERMRQNLGMMPYNAWALANERDAAMDELEAAKAAHELGLKKQVRLHLERAEDKFLFDASNKAVVLARRAGLGLKPLAKLSAEPGRRFEIRGARLQGQDVRWRFASIEEYERTVPAKILRDAKALRDAGFDWNDAYVGEPYVVEIRRVELPQKASDPILAVAVGRWLLEVGRWL